MMADVRTASGPGGEGGDAPDGWQAEPDVQPEIPEALYGKAKSARWNVERLRRLIEANLWNDVDALSLALCDRFGLLYALERQAAQVELLVTGRAAERVG